jgi:LPS export ABC transporter protein LptC
MTLTARQFLFLVVIVGSLGLLACEEKIQPSVLSDVDPQTLPRQESWNSTTVLSDSGRIKARIVAGYARAYDYPPRTLLSEGIRTFFYDEDGTQTSELTAQEGAVDEMTKNFEASGNVVVVSSDSTILRTSKLYWDNRRRLIHTPEFVRITTPKEQIQGFGFESDQNLREYRIFRVRGEAIVQ